MIVSEGRCFTGRGDGGHLKSGNPQQGITMNCASEKTVPGTLFDAADGLSGNLQWHPDMVMGNEYMFFDAALLDRFVTFVGHLGIASQVQPDRMAGFVVTLPDGLSDGLEADIELEYGHLMQAQRDLINTDEGGDARDVLGVEVNLPDGQTCLVRVPAVYGRRLAEHFSFEEIHALVTLIAHNVVNPVAGPLCRKL